MRVVKQLFFATLSSFSVNAFSQQINERHFNEKETRKPSEHYSITVDSAYQSANETEKYISEGYIIAELFKNSFIRSDKDLQSRNFMIQRSASIKLNFEPIKPD